MPWWQIEVEDRGYRLEPRDGERRIWRLRWQKEPYTDENGKRRYPRGYKYVGIINND